MLLVQETHLLSATDKGDAVLFATANVELILTSIHTNGNVTTISTQTLTNKL